MHSERAFRTLRAASRSCNTTENAKRADLASVGERGTAHAAIRLFRRQGLPIDPLAYNGGPTETHALLAGSPAIDHGSDCEPVDQRGAARSATACEIGAVEVTGQCISGGPVLCLNQGRFEVKVTWTTKDGTGAGQAVQLTDESGFFTFFDPSNIELTLKVLNGCGLPAKPRYWVFLSGLTNVGVQVTVTDTQTQKVKTYTNPLNKTFVPMLDTDAFDTCP